VGEPTEHLMIVGFVKISDRRHLVEVRRRDGTSEQVELDSRSFLRHDLAHYAVEAELGLAAGVWGSVAAGASFDSRGIDGADVELAERLAGPIQTAIRVRAEPDRIHAVLLAVLGTEVSTDVAASLHHRIRALMGAWAATPYGDVMTLTWPQTDLAVGTHR